MANEKFQMPIRLTANDIDINGLGRASAYLRYMQEVGIYQMEKDLPSDDELRASNQAFMVTRLDMKIHRPAKRGVELIGSSWASESKRATFKRGYSIFYKGDLIAEAYSQWTLVNLTDRKILKVDSVDLSNYYMGEYREIFLGKLKLSQEEIEQMAIVGERQVHLKDTDRNGHMNNTYYLDKFCDYIPELLTAKSTISGVRLHFAREAKLGETLTIKMGKRENSYIFQAINDAQELNVEAEVFLKLD